MKKSRPLLHPIIAISIIGVLIVGFIDYHTPPHMAFYLFYFPSICLVALRCSKVDVLLITVLCSVVWFISNSPSFYIYGPVIYIWNGTIRVFTFSFVAAVMTLMRNKENVLIATQSELRRHIDLEKSISRRDALTGVYNLRGFMERLEDEIGRNRRYGRPFSMIYLDIDDFKGMNDRNGHAYGDNALGRIGGVMTKSVRFSDTVGRLGGDEFVVLLPETSQDGALLCANKLLAEFNQDVKVSASLGIAVFDKKCPSAKDIIRIADSAMYQAKHQGKNSIFVAAPPETSARE